MNLRVVQGKRQTPSRLTVVSLLDLAGTVLQASTLRRIRNRSRLVASRGRQRDSALALSACYADRTTSIPLCS
eukprot:6044529-Amphidinium_carterae.2